MGTESITNRLKSERRDVTVQASISEHHSDLLDQFVEWCASLGIKTNRAGAIRAFVCDSLEAFTEFRDEEAHAPKRPTE